MSIRDWWDELDALQQGLIKLYGAALAILVLAAIAAVMLAAWVIRVWRQLTG